MSDDEIVRHVVKPRDSTNISDIYLNAFLPLIISRGKVLKINSIKILSQQNKSAINVVLRAHIDRGENFT